MTASLRASLGDLTTKSLALSVGKDTRALFKLGNTPESEAFDSRQEAVFNNSLESF